MKLFIKIIGISTLVMDTLLIFWTFMTAYFNDYKVLIVVNNYGEAHIEFWLMLITLPMAIATAYYFVKQEAKDKVNGH